jgi:hypothetical protein
MPKRVDAESQARIILRPKAVTIETHPPRNRFAWSASSPADVGAAARAALVCGR